VSAGPTLGRAMFRRATLGRATLVRAMFAASASKQTRSARQVS
jgi:hypothetical protein